ncbi:MAG: hypothetical protein ACO1N2_03455 [Candidatus Saccharimonadota bacterium]
MEAFKKSYTTSKQKTQAKVTGYFASRPRIRHAFLSAAFLIIFAEAALIIKPFIVEAPYDLGHAASLLPEVNKSIANKVTYDAAASTFTYSPSTGVNGEVRGIKTTFNADLKEGYSVTDPINNVALSVKATDAHYTGRQDGNRVVYPLKSNDGWAVYTIQASGIKEDILLTESKEDTRTFSYELALDNAMEARIESDGGLGVYGNTLLSSEISASSESDAALLEKMRKNAEKNTLLFKIPAPIVLEADGQESEYARAHFTLKDNILSVTTINLSRASYPLSIDPSIYVTSAREFMAGNNETNIDFNVDEQLIQKSPTTGARFDQWQDTLSLPVATSANGVAAAGGYIYSIGGRSFLGQAFNTQGAETFVVPAGVTSISVKVWGAGGGGGAGGSTGTGGAGGGGGYVTAAIPVTPGETLNVYVGGGGSGGGNVSNTGSGGGGGGYSSIYRGATPLVITAGGGGGGGSRIATTGGAGGAGGGTTGVAGSAVYANNGAGGGAGTASAGGAGGQGGNNSGTAGSSLTGGLGADGRSATTGADGGGGFGGLASGGAGGLANVNTTRAAGGGGGAGYFGGGGGGATSSTNNSSGGGGGGGSSYTAGGLSAVTNSAGSGVNPGNASDPVRNGASQGGAGGTGGQGGASGSNGAVFISYGSGTEVTKNVSWAEFNTTTGVVQSANPGSGTCAGWCSSNDYALPSERTNFSLVAYNGYLYAIGGVDASGNRTNTVYIAKIGANGEPRLWHPTNSNQSSWVYWYQDTNLTSVRSDFTATAYNNRLYLIGGRSTSGPVSSVQIADINPTGTLGTWATSTALPSNVYGHGAAIYNDRLYVLGGSNSVGGAPSTDVRYNKINADGTLNNWVQTTSLPQGRFTGGGTMAAVWGAYIYVSSGCSTVNASGYCTGVHSNIQLASINADGSLDSWNTVGTAVDERLGGNLIAWRGHLYRVGGCISQDSTTGDCGSATLDLIRVGKINRDGDASTVGESFASGSGTCTGGSPTQCNLPGTTYIGNMLTNSFIYNGHLYVTGGCTNNACSTTSNDVVYAAINTDGSIERPATCAGSYQGGAWCYLADSLPNNVAAASPVTFGGYAYLVGGLTGSANTNTLLRAELFGDGSLGPWVSQSMTGIGATNVSYSYAYARANPSSVATNPGNMFIFGGCTSSSSAGCTAYAQAVSKCTIALDGAVSGCSTSGQLQVGTVPGATGTGIGIMSGTVYANYIYLIGGVAPGLVDMKTVRYARFDNNNNVVAASGSAWVESPNQMEIGRRRTAAFGYNGYIYVAGGFEAGGGGVIADIEFIKVNVSDGSLGDATDGFTTSEVKINQRWGLTIAVSNSFAYVLGGCTVGDSPGACTTRTDVIQTFQIYNNVSGAPADYANAANRYTTNPNRLGASSTVLNGRLYTAGGCVSTTDCTNAVNTVSYATIDVNGNLGTWSNTTAALPADRAWGKLLNAGGSLYYLGGQSDTATDRRAEVYYATPSAGNVTSWGTATNGLPNARTKFGAATWNNRLYVVSGEGTTGTCASNLCSNVYVSPQLNSGGNISSAWSTSSPNMNVARSGLAVTAYANNLYLFGGFDGVSNYHSDSQYAQINASTGAVGSWTYSASLPKPIAFADAFAANGYMYIIGGRSSETNCDPSTLVAPVSANTTIASGNNPTGIGAWYESNQKYTTSRYGGASAYYDGKAYLSGGGCQVSTAPTVTSVTTTNTGAGFASDSTTHNVAMPGTTAAGDLLLMFFSYDSNGTPTVTDPDGAGGWTQLSAVNSANNGAFGSIWAKVATGTDGATVNFATSSTQSGAAQVYRIAASEWFGSLAGVEVASGTGSSTANPNPPALTPSWGRTENLWIAYAAGGTHTGVTTYPTDYVNGTHASGNTGANGASVSTATRTINTLTEDPGTFTMASSQTSVAFTVAIRPAAPVLTYAGTDEVQQTSLLSQPQIARYSLLMDTDTDVYPNAWLMNGIDNSVGANWQLRYRSMTNPTTFCTSPAMTTWGQETVFGNVTLGLPGVYVPKNAAGTNTNCARYFFFNVSVDSSQSYGYPDDVTRGPTIDSLTLQFTGDPSKRLMHGRTFTGGLQQPIDTPYYTY